MPSAAILMANQSWWGKAKEKVQEIFGGFPLLPKKVVPRIVPVSLSIGLSGSVKQFVGLEISVLGAVLRNLRKTLSSHISGNAGVIGRVMRKVEKKVVLEGKPDWVKTLALFHVLLEDEDKD